MEQIIRCKRRRKGAYDGHEKSEYRRQNTEDKIQKTKWVAFPCFLRIFGAFIVIGFLVLSVSKTTEGIKPGNCWIPADARSPANSFLLK